MPVTNGRAMELGSADAFERMGTLGVEEEFFIVDETGRPTSGIDELVYGDDPPEPLDGRVDHELFEFTLETQAPLMEDLSEAPETIRQVRAALVEHAHDHGYRIAAAGLHPAAKWRELEHATKPRYKSQLNRIQYPQHRNTTSGLHVHVGVDDPDKAVWIANELRWYLPPMLALSANSPYWNGFDTGLASARAKIFENLPNTGIPTAFDDFADYQRFERQMAERGAIDDRGELWFDVRPHTGHGTVEVRTPDAQAEVKHTLAFIEYVHALVMDFAARYEDGESSNHLRRELLDENKWRAIRHGHAADFITPDGEGVVDLGEFVDGECERLGLSRLCDVYDAESGAERQRRIHEESGFDAVCEDLTID
jgi:carboxylate-amine ligase